MAKAAFHLRSPAATAQIARATRDRAGGNKDKQTKQT
jgi:hypothetical protein